MEFCNLEIFERQADLYRTMANAKRLAIVEMLSHGEMCVGSIAETLDTSISTVSQHLRNMKDKSIVVMRKEGHIVYYRLKNPKIIDGYHLIRQILLDDLEAQGRVARDFDEENTSAP